MAAAACVPGSSQEWELSHAGILYLGAVGASRLRAARAAVSSGGRAGSVRSAPGRLRGLPQPRAGLRCEDGSGGCLLTARAAAASGLRDRAAAAVRVLPSCSQPRPLCSGFSGWCCGCCNPFCRPTDAHLDITFLYCSLKDVIVCTGA